MPRLAGEMLGFFNMFTDMSHRTHRTTKLFGLGLVALYVLNYLFLGRHRADSRGFDGRSRSRLDVVLILLLYNVLKRELGFYRETLANRKWWMGLPTAAAKTVYVGGGGGEPIMSKVDLG